MSATYNMTKGKHYSSSGKKNCWLWAESEMQHNFRQISDVSQMTIIGGLPRTMRVVLNTEKLSAYSMSAVAIVQHMQAANASVQAGR